MGKTHQSTTINRSPADVWATIKAFHDMSWCSNVITDLKKVGDKAGNEIGAKRLLNDAFHETLHELDGEGMRIRYSIDDGPPPISKDDVANYFGVLTLTAEGDSTRVDWNSSWDGDNEESGEFCHQIYLALLADMKASMEG